MTKFYTGNALKRLKCLLFGHRFLYDGTLKDKNVPSLVSYKYKTDETTATSTEVGLCFCPDCYQFFGVHYTIQEPKKEILEKAKKEIKKAAKFIESNKTKKKKK